MQVSSIPSSVTKQSFFSQMGHNQLFTSNQFSPVFMMIKIITFLLVVETAFSADSQFEACSKPFSCSKGPKISFPFWVQGEQQPFCGYPGFQLSCNNNEPTINISGNDYIIRDISYKTQSLLVTKASVQNNLCSTLAKNLTLDSSPFTFGSAQGNIILFFNCNTSFPSDYVGNSINCVASYPARRALAMFSHDSALDDVRKSVICGNLVSLPVKTGNGILGTNISRDSVIDLLNQGFSMNWDDSNCAECVASGGRCGFNSNASKFECFCTNRSHFRSCKSSNGRKKIIIAAIVAGTLITVAAIAILCWYFKNKSNTSMILWKRKAKNVNIVETFLRDCGLLAPNRFKYKDVKKITSSFKDIIGQGGFGSVFKGKLPDARLVAVKILSETKGNGKDFINEVATISRTSHVNIVSLLGFCVQGTKRALIYEFMPNGSLEKFIYDTPLNAHAHLGWETLYKIAIGIARGLEYLHRGCNTRILHLDIKPHNILLDQDFTPKIADFGLSKLCHLKESQVSMTGARGTAGYIAPEMVSRNFGAVSHKADVYSYGMMVLEMVGGRKNIDVRVTNVSEVYFPHWIYNRLDLNEDLGLHEINSLEDQEIARKMILVGLWCIQIDPVNRPPMSRVLDMLEGSLEALQLPPKPFLTSSPREEVSSSRTIISTV